MLLRGHVCRVFGIARILLRHPARIGGCSVVLGLEILDLWLFLRSLQIDCHFGWQRILLFLVVRGQRLLV